MAGIFNLFGGINESERAVACQATKAIIKSKSATNGANGMLPKSSNSLKPKGLSMRSTSALNIPSNKHVTPIKQDINKQLQETIPKVTQVDINGRPLSPRMKTLDGKSNKMKGLSAKKELLIDESLKTPKKVLDDNIFKKPLLPKKYNKRVYPEPEKLAPYCDMESYISNTDLDAVAKEFAELMKAKERINSNSDEEFIPELEDLSILDLPQIRCWSPAVSDYEEFLDVSLSPIKLLDN